MKKLTRRQMMVQSGALVTAATVGAGRGQGQTQTMTAPTAQASQALAQARVFAYDIMPAIPAPSGGERRDVVAGRIATGETVALHESVLPVGAPPNPPHRIEHTEFIHVCEGELEFIHDGHTERAGPGSVIYVAYGTMHGVRNIGKTAARYLVLAIGGDVKP